MKRFELLCFCFAFGKSGPSFTFIWEVWQYYGLILSYLYVIAQLKILSKTLFIFFSVRSCQDLKDLNWAESGEYMIRPDDQGPMNVYCDQETDGGGWIVLQRRLSPFDTNFNRNWDEYRNGFGDLSGEFWLGNDIIHRLTATPVSLRIEFQEQGATDKKYARYENFVVAGADDKYRWNMDSYSGDLANAIYGHHWSYWRERGMQFSTPDNDNDNWPGGKCIVNSGWWANWCGLVDLNKTPRPYWDHVSDQMTTDRMIGLFSEMKIR